MSSVPHIGEDAWALTCALTPRDAVRELDGGDAVSRRGMATRPDRPWAMYLARRLGRDRYAMRYLGFDFDAKHGHTYELVLEDVAVLTTHLDRLGIAYLACRSSEHGGIHVWVAMRDDLAPATAARIADLAKNLMPSLDVAPLANAAAGCLRPPYAPHHSGSRSEPIAGTLTTLLEPATTVEDAAALLDALRAAQPATAPTPAASTLLDATRAPARAVETHGRLPVDAAGHVFLPGSRRPLPAAAAAALRTVVHITDDASAILATILCGAARAHWRYADVAELLDAAPGLERARTVRDGDVRVPRPSTGHLSPAALLAAEWQRCARYVASTPTTGAGDDPTFTMRLHAVTEIAETVQARADAMPGRWSHDGGPADRRILDRLCAYALAAVSGSVDAAARRLATDTGVGRSTAAAALLRLAADGWIAVTEGADGPRAATYILHPQSDLHRESTQGRTQAATAAARRLHLLTLLRRRTQAAAHDAFAYGALGLHSGNVYASLAERGHAPLSRDLGQRRLLEHGLARTDGLLVQPTTDRRDAIARVLGFAGLLADRSARYRIEREVWAWWLAELDWMQTKGRQRTARRSTSPVLWHTRSADHYPAMPRQAGRVRLDLARAQVEAGILTAPLLGSTPQRIAA